MQRSEGLLNSEAGQSGALGGRAPDYGAARLHPGYVPNDVQYFDHANFRLHSPRHC